MEEYETPLLSAVQEVNNINDQLDATVTILLIFESAQHVSGNLLPIFRSVRLQFTAMWCIILMQQQVGGSACGGVNYVFGVRDVARAISTGRRLNPKPYEYEAGMLPNRM